MTRDSLFLHRWKQPNRRHHVFLMRLKSNMKRRKSAMQMQSHSVHTGRRYNGCTRIFTVWNIHLFKKCTAGGFIRIGSHGWLSGKAFICCRQTALCCSYGRCRLWEVNADTQPVFSRLHSVLNALGCSISRPDISQLNCCHVSWRTSWLERGQRNLPFTSMRLYRSTKPSFPIEVPLPSHNIKLAGSCYIA